MYFKPYNRYNHMDRKTNYFDEISRNKAKSLVLMLIIGALYAVIAYTFSYYLINEFLRYGVIGYFLGLHILPYDGEFSDFLNFSLIRNVETVVFSILLAAAYLIYSYSNASAGILAYNKAKEAKRDEYPELYGAIEGLAGAAQIPMPKVYIQENDDPNAFATGINRHNASITVTTGLLSIMRKDELQGVLAHEVSHIANNDIQFMVVAMAFAGAMGVFTALARFVVFLEALLITIWGMFAAAAADIGYMMAGSVAQLIADICFFVVALLLIAFVIVYVMSPVGAESLAQQLFSEHPALIIVTVGVVIIALFYDIFWSSMKKVFISFIAPTVLSGVAGLALALGLMYFAGGGLYLTDSFTVAVIASFCVMGMASGALFRAKIAPLITKTLFPFFICLSFSVFAAFTMAFYLSSLVGGQGQTSLDGLAYSLLLPQNAVLFGVGVALLVVTCYKIIIPVMKYAESKDPGYAILVAMVLFPVVFIMAAAVPILMILIRLAVSRKREFLADANGARIIRNPNALARALEKISGYNEKKAAKTGKQNALQIIDALVNNYKKSLMTMIYFNPADFDLRGLVSDLFSTHPTLEQRIKILKNMH